MKIDVELNDPRIQRVIASVDIFDKNALTFVFDDGTELCVVDRRQDCCEVRWMSTDDDLSYYVGAQLLSLDVRGGPPDEETDGGDIKESQFLVVMTSRGAFTVNTYVEHNGYYGGFDLGATLIKKEPLRFLCSESGCREYLDTSLASFTNELERCQAVKDAGWHYEPHPTNYNGGRRMPWCPAHVPNSDTGSRN